MFIFVATAGALSVSSRHRSKPGANVHAHVMPQWGEGDRVAEVTHLLPQGFETRSPTDSSERPAPPGTGRSSFPWVRDCRRAATVAFHTARARRQRGGRALANRQTMLDIASLPRADIGSAT
jgi:hypothetical protein